MMCQDHWDALREAIKERGLQDRVADREDAVMQMQGELAGGDPIADPLLAAYFAVLGNVAHVLERAGSGGVVLYFMQGEAPEDPVEGFPEYEGRTWPRCGLCYLNLAHEMTCTDAACTLDKERGYDDFIARAADEQQERYAQTDQPHPEERP